MNLPDTQRELPQGSDLLNETGPELLRSRLLQQTLNATTIGVGLVLLAGAYPLILARNWNLLGIGAAFFLLALVTANIKTSTYRARTLSLLFVCYAAGIISLFVSPYLGAAQLWFLCFTAFSVSFFSLGSGILAAIFSGLSLFGVGYTITLSWLPVQVTGNSFLTGLAYWIISALLFVLVALVITAVQYNYTNSWESETAELRQKNFQLQSEQEYLISSEQKLGRRLRRLQTIFDICQLANRISDPDQQAEQLIEVMQSKFDLYFVGLLLIDELGEQAVLKAGSGEAGMRMIADGFQIPMAGTSAVGMAINLKKPRVLRRTGDETTLSIWPYLPASGSELALPLKTDKRVIGALTFHSTHANAFEEDDLVGFQNLADALAAAIENTNQFKQMQSKLAESESLNRQYLLSAWNNQINNYIRKQYTYEKAGKADFSTPAKIHKTPLFVRDQAIGDLILESGETPWSAEEIQLIDAVAAQTAQALENARLIQETQQKAFQEQLIGDFSSRIRESFSLDAMLRTAVRELGDRLNLAEVEAYIGWEDPESRQSE
jgi:GAF domain-containing protein